LILLRIRYSNVGPERKYPSGQHTFLAPTPKAMMST